MLFLLLTLLICFYLLAQICDKAFVPSLDILAKKLKLSEDAAGATLMAVGSSAPELFIALIALFTDGGHAEIGMGTIVGSAIFNILAIVGASALVKTASLTWRPIFRDIVFYSISILALLLIFQDGQITLLEASIFVALYGLYIFTVTKWQSVFPEPKQKQIKEAPPHHQTPHQRIQNHYIAIFFLSITAIAALSYVLVKAAIALSAALQIPTAIVALTVLAIGTSIPDLIASVIVARQGRTAMAISNAVGSNIFDILFGLGFPWLIMLAIQKQEITVSTANLESSIILLFATVIVLLTLFLVRKWRIGRHSGLFLIGLYFAYLAWAIHPLL